MFWNKNYKDYKVYIDLYAQFAPGAKLQQISTWVLICTGGGG